MRTAVADWTYCLGRNGAAGWGEGGGLEFRSQETLRVHPMGATHFSVHSTNPHVTHVTRSHLRLHFNEVCEGSA